MNGPEFVLVLIALALIPFAFGNEPAPTIYDWETDGI